MGKKKKKKTKYIDYDKYEKIDMFEFNREWKRIFENWDGKTHKKYKHLPLHFKDELSGKMIINKKKKSLRPLDVFMIQTYPDKYSNRKTETPEERIQRREKILEKQSMKLEKMQMKQEQEMWKEIDYNLKHPNKRNEKLSKNEQKIMDFFNKRNGTTTKQLKEKEKENTEKYNKLDIFEFKVMADIDELKALKARSGRKGWVYGYNKKGKRRNPNKSLAHRQMKRYDEQNALHAIDVFKETLVEEIEARLMFDPFSISNHPVIEYDKYSSNINKDISKKDKKHKKEKNKINMGRLII